MKNKPFDDDNSNVSIILSDHIDFLEYPEATVRNIPVIKREWVEQCVKLRTLVSSKPFSPDPMVLFAGVHVVCDNTLNIEDQKSIYGGVQAMGGLWSLKVTDLTTHVITTSTDTEMCENAKKFPRVEFVLPHWIDDTLKLRRKISHFLYAFPDPKILQHSNYKVDRHLPCSELSDTRYLHNLNLTVPLPKSKLFISKTFFLADDLSDPDEVRNVIVKAGGTISEVMDSDNVKIYIGNWREGITYKCASSRHMFIGTPTWIYWMVEHNTWASPIRRLLHYPLVRGGLPSMHGMEISISQYSGDGRRYIQDLIEALGAKFTRTLRESNTHLITTEAFGNKYKAARYWNINVVNQLWLEDTYAEWELKSCALDRYIYFPRHLNLIEVAGQTQLNARVLRKFYHEELEDKKDLKNFDYVDTTSIMTIQERSADIPDHVNQVNIHATPEASILHITPAPESGSPFFTPPPRIAKRQAAVKVEQDIEDVKEIKNIRPKREAPSPETYSASPAKKRRKSSNPLPSPEFQEPPSTSLLTSLLPSSPLQIPTKQPMRLLITGIEGMITRNTLKILSKIHIQVVSNALEATHVIAPRICRTQNFLISLSSAPVLLNKSYLMDSIEAGKALPVSEKYLLSDPLGETTIGRSISQVLGRARKLKGTLLKGYTFNLTPGIRGGFDVFNTIVTAHGGSCVKIKSPSLTSKCKFSDSRIVILISKAEQHSYISAFKKHFAKLKVLSYCFPADWLLVSILRMEIDFNSQKSF